MKLFDKEKEEFSKRLIAGYILINKEKKTTTLVQEYMVGYSCPVITENNQRVYKRDLLQYVPVMEDYYVKETRSYMVKTHPEDKYDEEVGIILVYCYAIFGSKTQFYKLCGKNDPIEFAKNYISNVYGSVKKFMNELNFLVPIKRV